MEHFFFSSWTSILRTLVITLLAYVALIALLRWTGKRTLSKMNSFDFVVTIALGSTLATVALNKSVPLADGVLAFFVLIMLQFIITWLSARYQWVSDLVKSSPKLLVYKGELLKDQLLQERINEDEVYAAIRKHGGGSLEQAAAVVLETDGSLTVIKRSAEAVDPILKDVNRGNV